MSQGDSTWKPAFPRAYVSLAGVLMDQHKLPEAIAAYRKAIELKPDYASAYGDLGNALHDQRKLPEACCLPQVHRNRPPQRHHLLQPWHRSD